MSNATGLKTKKTPLPAICPPESIRDNTKARRAWLAEELEKVNADPTREGKITGNGSYQRISVYAITQVEGRIQLRGTCQYCGGLQVVKDGVLVLHGYTRPGDGMVYGRCPGMQKPALNVDTTWTLRFQDEATQLLAAKDAELVERKQVHAAAVAECKASGENWSLFTDRKPRKPESWNMTADSMQKYVANVNAHNAASPKCYARWIAMQAERDTLAQVQQLNALLQHFATLLDSGIHGTELVQNVVA